MKSAILAFALVLATAAYARAATTIPLIDLGDGHFGVNVSVGGSAPQLFAIDTGAGANYASAALAKALKLQTIGTYDYVTFNGRHFLTPIVELAPLAVGAAALPGGSAIRFEGFDRMGLPSLLTAPAFANAPVTFDLGKHTMILEDPTSLAARVRGLKRIPLTLKRDGPIFLLPLVDVDFGNGQHGRCIIDTGSGSTMLNARYMAAFGLKPDDPNVQSQVTNQPSGKIRQSFAKIPKVELQADPAMHAVPNVGFQEAPDGKDDCQLGNDFWTGKIFTLDLASGALYVAPSH
ncbi:MAG TPA: retropepsin-like aspartic protease [Candidatus Acidoferrales bacterium]|jgi:predicted aspartyl protease|nr:retropepsin-like aspartic protease [Candidatus Acidoferrales bacterium]